MRVLRKLRYQFRDYLQNGTSRHVEIEDENIGMMPAYVPLRGIGVTGFGHDLKVGLGVKHELQAVRTTAWSSASTMRITDSAVPSSSGGTSASLSRVIGRHRSESSTHQTAGAITRPCADFY